MRSLQSFLATGSGLVVLFLLSISIMVIIDYFLKEKAEFFDAYTLLLFGIEQLTGTVEGVTRTFMVGQEKLGAWAFPTGLTILIGIHSLSAVCIQFIIKTL